MARTLGHRGPDGEGVWVDSRAPIALGHRRLAIIDTSTAGYQPMRSASGRYVAVFNGEVYNHGALAKELKRYGHPFEGHSDTEVLLAAIEQWGVDKALQESNGMLALAVWDRQERILHLARDRLGKKPLYYGLVGGQFVFASELKAFRVLGNAMDVDCDALTLLLRHNYIPAPYCIYRGVYKLMPGYVTSLSIDQIRRSAPSELPSRGRPYWNAGAVVEASLSQPFEGTASEAADELERVLGDAVRLRTVADVPVGALLSGGVDSSVVTALMQSQSERPVRTFSIGFREQEFDESQHARAVAAHLGTDHTELYVSSRDALDVIPQLPGIYDEPFSDSSQVPTYLVSKLTRTQVTVALSGDGGDELFCGYARFHAANRLWRQFGWLPRWAASGLGVAAARIASPRVYWSVGPLLRRFDRRVTAGKLLRVRDLLNAKNSSRAALYKDLVSHWKDPEHLVLGGTEPPTVLDDPRTEAAFYEFRHQMMFLDLVSYLTDDILVKVDRASMAVGLEARCPLLDPRVIELAWQLPLAFNAGGPGGKAVLKDVLYRYVPRSLVDRPKQGFGVPLAEWLRGPLREWGEELLRPERLRQEGFFNSEPIRRCWADHQAGRGNWHYYLWDVLMFQAWLEETKSMRAVKPASSELVATA